jgi:hypothetical protein
MSTRSGFVVDVLQRAYADREVISTIIIISCAYPTESSPPVICGPRRDLTGIIKKRPGVRGGPQE